MVNRMIDEKQQQQQRQRQQQKLEATKRRMLDGNLPSRKYLDILLVEGDPQATKAIQERLSRGIFTRFQSTQVSLLADALAALKTKRFDAVLANLFLPDSTGLE